MALAKYFDTFSAKDKGDHDEISYFPGIAGMADFVHWCACALGGTDSGACADTERRDAARFVGSPRGPWR
jgi:hypothetical protein